ncbi:MAG: FIST N-terminal domain-containing protein [Burkholderiaceae bacterium]
MQLHTLQYTAGQGFSPGLDGALDGEQTLMLAFGAPAFGDDPTPLAALASAYPRAVKLGCSTAGEIFGTQVHDASLSVAVARFDHTRLRHASAAVPSPKASHLAGAALARQLAGDDLRAVFVLSDGLRVNGTALVAGIGSVLPPTVPVTGGLAGDGSRFARTWVLDGDAPHGGRVCAVGLYGERVRVGHGCDHGWVEFGPARRVTRSQGHVLYELDGKPALQLYKTYLGELASGLPGTALLYPLAVWRSEHDPRHLVRTVLAIDEDAQSLTFAGDIPEGSFARLMRSTNDKLIDSAGQAGEDAANGAGAGATGHGPLVVSVSCVGRRLLLGERTDEELEIVQAAAHGGAHVGFYSYGEISPAPGGAGGELHNQTMTVTVIDEA